MITEADIGHLSELTILLHLLSILQALFFFDEVESTFPNRIKRAFLEMASKSDPDRSASASHDDEDHSEGKETTAPETTPKKPGLLKRVWTGLGLDPATVITMAKGALPPIISLAALQSPTMASKYSTLGYLVAIMSLLGFAIMPRAKFVQNMTLNIVCS